MGGGWSDHILRFVATDRTDASDPRDAAKLRANDPVLHRPQIGGLGDLVGEAYLQTYDYCAMVAVIEGAGGVATDWQGRPLGLASDGRSAIAGDARAHAAVLERLAALA